MRHLPANRIDADSIAYANAAVADRVHFVVIHDDWSVEESPFKTLDATVKWQAKNCAESHLVRVCKSDPPAFVFGATKKKLKQISDDNPDHINMVYLSGESNFRYSLPNLTLPYKGNRTKTIPPKHLKAVREYLITYHDAIVTEDCEADDAVIFEHRRGDIISCIDKDIHQYATHFYNYNTREHHTVSAKQAAINFWTQVWTGDAADNIPGLSHWCKRARIGPKKIEKQLLLAHNHNYIDCLELVYRNNIDDREGIDKFGERLEEQCSLLWLQRFKGETLNSQEIEDDYRYNIINSGEL